MQSHTDFEFIVGKFKRRFAGLGNRTCCDSDSHRTQIIASFRCNPYSFTQRINRCRGGAGRATCYVLAPDRMSLGSVRVWDGAATPATDGHVRRDVTRLDWVCRVAEAGHPFVVRSLDDLPEEAGADRETLAEMGVEALLAFPLVQERTLVGLLTVEVLSREGDREASRPEGPVADWTEEEISLARVVADQLAGLFVWSWDSR